MARCQICKQRGRCTCQRRINADAARRPAAQPTLCTVVCQPKTKAPCGATKRGGICPCSYC